MSGCRESITTITGGERFARGDVSADELFPMAAHEPGRVGEAVAGKVDQDSIVAEREES
jgi:hypothetical protein